MTEQEREELVVKMANEMFASKQYNGCFALMDMARAALAVAEPVIREECAKMAEKRACMIDCCEATGVKIAAAIREGGKEG